MKVSLCGPHSFETSTFPFTLIEEVLSGLASPPLSRMNSYLLHHVGSCELFCAVTFGERLETQRPNATNAKRPKIAKRCLFVMNILPWFVMCAPGLSKDSGLGVDSISTYVTAKAESAQAENN